MLVSGGGFGEPVCTLSLRERAKHSNFAGCNRCAEAKEKWMEYRQRANRCSAADAQALKLEIFSHIDNVKKERQAAMEMHQMAAARSYMNFQYDDKCGSEFCFMPTPGSRHTAATACMLRLPTPAAPPDVLAAPCLPSHGVCRAHSSIPVPMGHPSQHLRW